MQTIWLDLETTEDMAFSEENQKWIQDQIQQAVYPNGFRKVAGWLRYWSLLASLIAIFLVLITVSVTLGIALSNRANQEAEFRGKTGTRLDNIESALGEIKKQLISQSLSSHAALPLRDFETSLPALHTSLASAQQNNLKISDSVLGELSNKLAETKSTEPSFWPTAATLISYRSSVLVGTPQGWREFPPCRGATDLDSSPNASIQNVNPEGKPIGPKIAINRIGVQDCTIQLDGKTASRWDCTRCVIKYSGGPISLHDVRFVDCLFIFEIPKNHLPTPTGLDFSHQLLASDLKNVEIRSI